MFRFCTVILCMLRRLLGNIRAYCFVQSLVTCRSHFGTLLFIAFFILSSDRAFSDTKKCDVLSSKGSFSVEKYFRSVSIEVGSNGRLVIPRASRAFIANSHRDPSLLLNPGKFAFPYLKRNQIEDSLTRIADEADGLLTSQTNTFQTSVLLSNPDLYKTPESIRRFFQLNIDENQEIAQILKNF